MLSCRRFIFNLGINGTPIRLQRFTGWQRAIFGKRPLLTFIRAAILATVLLGIGHYLLIPVAITGASMEPTFLNGQCALLNTLPYHFTRPARGDVIGFHTEPGGPLIVKRILAMPGERIAFHRGQVQINGVDLAEPYLTGLGVWEWPEETLPPATYFTAGDNREVTQLFRVMEKNISGKIQHWHP